MSRKNRPDPFAIAYPDEFRNLRRNDSDESGSESTHASGPIGSRGSSVGSSGTATSLGKRKSPFDSQNISKRRQLPQAGNYVKPPAHKEIRERAQLIIEGEGPGEDDDAEGDQKPVRILTDFAIFDPKRGNEMVMLDALEHDDGVDRQFEAAGMVTPYFEIDEDAGQDEQEIVPVYVRLSAILRFTFDCTVEASPVYIETQYAWYILRTPSAAYKEHWVHFCTPRIITQLLVSRSVRRPKDDYASFLLFFKSQTFLHRTFVEADIWEHLLDIRDNLDDPDLKRYRTVPFIAHILSKAPARVASPFQTRRRGTAQAPPKLKLGHNIDLAVLKPENQGITTVTTRIAKLADGHFHGHEINVAGIPPPLIKPSMIEKINKKRRRRVWELMQMTCRKRAIDFKKTNRFPGSIECYTEITLDGVCYKVGDVILLPAHTTMPEKESQLPTDCRIHDFFWFAKVHYFNPQSQSAHIQWFNHGSQTFIGELAHPQELFLANHCGAIKLLDVVGKVNVFSYPDELPRENTEDYFVKFMHTMGTGAFTRFDQARMDMFSAVPAPDNCPSCSLEEERINETNAREVRDEYGNRNGVAFGGTAYHYEDFVLYRAEKGPANIAYITGVDMRDQKKPTVTGRMVGRISDLMPPRGVLKDERHLYLTEETVTFPVDKLLKVIYVPCLESIEGPNRTDTLEDWLALSYDHFYLQYCFPKLKGQNWNQRSRISWQDLHVCTPCCKERLEKRKLLYQFLAQQRRKPLKTLDLFGGVGAFSRGIAEGSGSLKITHAIEISPSAAKTFARNSPETVVFNQCANEMLRYIIKTHEKHSAVEAPRDKINNKAEDRPPPGPKEVDVITAGFPCQSHSGLNMFKNAQDKKSNLILTTLSYVDHYRPKFGYFENVPGFLRYALGAEQSGIHTTKGGIPSGGLKLFVRALLDMGYQVRVGQLQAGHYGTPQRRVRFFIVAAKADYMLPDFPQPTHDFPENKTLEIRVKVDGTTTHTLAPVRFSDGISQHRCVTIEDSIFDLPRFDWQHPRKPMEWRRKQGDGPGRIALECHKKEISTCGFTGNHAYLSSPQTRYQLMARSLPTTDIQHFTRRFSPLVVERVLNIRMAPNADYRTLPEALREWQSLDPSSARGRKGYNQGAYGRTDKDSVFQTTVTNMEPTAKQCRVLHPRDRRMFTVREFARSQGFPDSFVFEALGNNVVTMHRQIGNAVPLPMGHALGRELRESLFQEWKHVRENAIVVESDNEDDTNGPPQQALVVQEREDSFMDIY